MIKLLFLMLLVPTLAFGATTEALKALLTQTTTAKGRFAQMVLDKNMKKLQESTGTMQFSRPGKFRWEYNKPFEQVIVGDGSKLWIYDKDLNQVTERKLDKALGASPAALLAGSNEIEKSYTLQSGRPRLAGGDSQIQGHRLRARAPGFQQGWAGGDGIA
jgi:outer membrane lipoprotein carrier protein